MNSLEGKRAFITGASRGIGAAIARKLAAEGADVAIGYGRSVSAAQALADEVKVSGRRAYVVEMDARAPASVSQAVNHAAKSLGGLDILVNNAGIIVPGQIDENSEQDIDDVLFVNLRAAILAARAALAYLPEGGRIISIGSNLAERVTLPGLTVYSASKAGLIGFTKGLARDLGPKGITVNLVHPGSTDTDMNPPDGPTAEIQRSRMAIPRYGDPADVAALVAFVAGPQGKSITGAGLSIDGGANA